MKEVECISCKQEIPLTGPFVEFECPVCGAKIARCENAVLSGMLINVNVVLKDHKYLLMEEC